MMNPYKALANIISSKYQSTPNLTGIIWIGSATFGINDDVTDIDIRLVCKKNNPPVIMEQFKTNGVKVEVAIMDQYWLLKKVNPAAKQAWIRQHAQLLFMIHKIY